LRQSIAPQFEPVTGLLVLGSPPADDQRDNESNQQPLKEDQGVADLVTPKRGPQQQEDNIWHKHQSSNQIPSTNVVEEVMIER